MTLSIKRVLVTGGAGFIGSAVCRHLVASGYGVVNVDKLTYAGNLESLRDLAGHSEYRFHQLDICDEAAVLETMRNEHIDAVMHLAAESHVDRSIDGPAEFLQTNVVGTFSLLNAALTYWRELQPKKREAFRFHHVSTDEVFGDLAEDDPPFDENTPYRPSSPYSASKAASDHLARAFHRTYGLPVAITNCSNNYGPYQHPEKLIPLMVLNALRGLDLPIYGDGRNIRDWLYVEDHCAGLEAVLERGRIGETYCIGGGSERRNVDVVATLCDAIDRRFAADPALAGAWPDCPAATGGSCRDLIRFVTDRPGHDHRYAIDSAKIADELGVRPRETFESGIGRTVDWYVDNGDWWRQALNADFSDWVRRHYGAATAGATAR